jgi:hypothetical protein
MTSDSKRVQLFMNLKSQRAATSVTRFLLRFLELQVAMGVGALLCFLLGRIIPPTSLIATTYYPGSYLYAAGDVFFLTFPVVAWMMFRNYERRTSLGMAVAMLAPVAAIALVGEVAGYAYLPWLIVAGYPAMSFGMFVYMLLYRPQEPQALRRAATWN